MLVVEDVYAASKRFPTNERYGLTFQLRRAAISIPSNIGEGSRRSVELAVRLGYLKTGEYSRIQDRVAGVDRC